MGVHVIVEVMDHWPDLGLTRGERDDLLVIAENVNDVSRETYRYGIYQPYLLRRAGKQHAAWKNAVGALMKKGVLRYAVHGGVEQTAHRGHVAVYRIPVLCPDPPHDGLLGQCTRMERVVPDVTQSKEKGHSAGDPMGPRRVIPQMTQSKEKGHPPDDPIQRKGHLGDDEWVIPQMTPTPLTPQQGSPLSVESACIRKFAVLPEREEKELAQWITREHSPHGPGWWRKLTENGDLGMIIESWKVRRTPTPPRIVRTPAPPDCDAAEPNPQYLDARNGARKGGPSRHAVDPGTYDLAEKVLGALEYAERARWRAAARAELPGARQVDERAVTIRAAELLAAASLRSHHPDPDGNTP